MKLISGLLVGCFGIFLTGLAIVSAFLPSKAQRFLALFASSQRAHFLEQFLRLITGTALVFFASEMWFSEVFYFFGWLIVVTSVILLLLPWRLHQRFSKLTVPQVINYLKLFALGAFALGMFVFYGMSRVFF